MLMLLSALMVSIILMFWAMMKAASMADEAEREYWEAYEKSNHNNSTNTVPDSHSQS